MLYIFKCLAGSGPAYLTSGLTLYKPGHEGLRSGNDSSRLTEYKIRNWTLASAADKAFFYAAPKQWNKLPIDIRSSSSEAVFKKSLKHHFFHKFNCMLLYLACCMHLSLFFEYIPCNYSSFLYFLRCGLLEMARYKSLSYVCMYVTLQGREKHISIMI